MTEYIAANDFRNYLSHHGIKGQKWGERNGPPYPLDADDHSVAERKAQGHYEKHIKAKAYRMGMTKSEQESFYQNHKKAIKTAAAFLGVTAGAIGGYYLYTRVGKRFMDTTLKKGTSIHTLASSKERMNGAQYIYEAHLNSDRHTYKGLFGSSNGRLKVDISNKLSKDFKIASEKTLEDHFINLFKNDKDFADYVTNKMDLSSIKDKEKMNTHYTNALKTLKEKKGKYTDKDLKTIHKIYEYAIPNEGEEARLANEKFFNSLKKSGYSGMIDLNDSIYGHYHTRQSNIIFDLENLVTEDVKQLRPSDQVFGAAVTVGRQSMPYLIGGGSVIVAKEYVDRQDQRQIDKIYRERK